MIRIELGNLPPKELSPNYNRKAHWCHRARAQQWWRELVYISALEARIKARPKGYLPYKKVKLTWTFVYRMNRKRDVDNLIAACKTAQDCLVLAGLIKADDSEHLKLGETRIIVDKNQLSQAIIEIEEV